MVEHLRQKCKNHHPVTALTFQAVHLFLRYCSPICSFSTWVIFFQKHTTSLIIHYSRILHPIYFFLYLSKDQLMGPYRCSAGNCRILKRLKSSSWSFEKILTKLVSFFILRSKIRMPVLHLIGGLSRFQGLRSGSMNKVTSKDGTTIAYDQLGAGLPLSL